MRDAIKDDFPPFGLIFLTVGPIPFLVVHRWMWACTSREEKDKGGRNGLDACRKLNHCFCALRI